MKKLACFFSSNNSANQQPNKVAEEVKDSKEIDSQMKAEREKQKKTIRILLLGPGDSGKTTILKQMKKIHNSHDEADARNMTEYIRDAVVGYMKMLCYQSKVLHDQHDEKTLVSSELEEMRLEFLQLQSPYDLTVDTSERIRTLWTDTGIQETLRKRHYYQIHDNFDCRHLRKNSHIMDDTGIQETLRKRHYYQIHDNVAYFLERVDELVKSTYVPSFEDYLRIRTRSTGFSQTKLIANIDRFGQHIFEFTDVGGQRSERKKWMRFIYEDINAVLYVIAISDYDLKLFEDNKTNRLVEAINLFKTIMIKGKFFGGKSVLLFFNKYDLFKKKIKEVPITVAFDDFPSNEMNPNDEDDVVRFVAGKFLQVFEDQNVTLAGPLHILRTTALDTDNIDKVFKDITLDLVKQNLRNYGIM
eukprot:CAMPEP_0202729514 /NCGR_PEP_ID=MMETSP1385-20130828/186168_1 /ASSEMBLY_ACC=CAM_ASM_000861 /TAXON_ID=933848 /ORGANISM="Elphidium margaritaceum" /LENGTH=414 /DNA_ID=CAMNT_0049395779 /DNA_START=121 /DNA_END=1366 /DNA_ORIENTATION=+